jgi:hypothetical protein
MEVSIHKIRKLLLVGYSMHQHFKTPHLLNYRRSRMRRRFGNPLSMIRLLHKKRVEDFGAQKAAFRLVRYLECFFCFAPQAAFFGEADADSNTLLFIFMDRSRGSR